MTTRKVTCARAGPLSREPPTVSSICCSTTCPGESPASRYGTSENVSRASLVDRGPSVTLVDNRPQYLVQLSRTINSRPLEKTLESRTEIGCHHMQLPFPLNPKIWSVIHRLLRILLAPRTDDMAA